MKKNYDKRFSAAWLLLLAMLAIVSCKQEGEYINALPKDAAVVVSFDLKGMALKSGLQGENGKKVLSKLGSALKDGMRGSEELVDRIMENPDESGLKLTDKVYFFIEPGALSMGVVANVSESGKLDELFGGLHQNGVCEEVQNADGGGSYVVLQSAIAAYTDQAFVLLVDTKGGAGRDLIHTAQSILRQKKAESFAGSDDFDALAESKSDIAMWGSLAIMPAEYTAMMRMGMTAEMNLADIKYLLESTFEKGKVVVEIKDLTTDKTMLEMQKKQAKTVKKLKGTYLDRFDANTFLWIGLGLDGEDYYEALMENPSIRQILDGSMIPVDFKSILSALDGDAVFAIPVNSVIRTAPAFILLAEVNDTDFLSTFEDLKPMLAMAGGSMVLENDGAQGYCFRSINTGAVYFGVKDGSFYLTTDRTLVDNSPKGLTLADTAWGKEVKGNIGYVGINIASVMEIARKAAVARMNSAGVTQAAQIFDYFAGGSKDGKQWKMELALQDKQKNLLELLASLVN